MFGLRLNDKLMQVHSYIHAHIRTHTYVHIYTHIHTHTNIYTHTYMHTYKKGFIVVDFFVSFTYIIKVQFSLGFV